MKYGYNYIVIYDKHHYSYNTANKAFDEIKRLLDNGVKNIMFIDLNFGSDEIINDMIDYTQIVEVY